MSTLSDMKARIAAELVRSDITSDIAAAIPDAITAYQRERFRFMEPYIGGEPAFNTVNGQMTYGDFNTTLLNLSFPFLGTLISNMIAIDFMTYVQAGVVFLIWPDTKRSVKIGNQNALMQGMPQDFAYAGNAITLYPVPNQVFTISIFGHCFVAAPASDVEANNPWMNVAERLIRSRAKYILAKHKLRNPTLAQAMSPDPPAENGGVVGEAYRTFKELKKETNRIASTGRIAAMQF